MQTATAAPSRTAFAATKQTLAEFRAPALPQGARYALWPRFEMGVKPFAFPSLAALARHIHRQRGGPQGDCGVQFAEEPGHFIDGRRNVVRIDALDADGAPAWLIGYAYLGGGGRDVLTAALRANEPEAGA